MSMRALAALSFGWVVACGGPREGGEHGALLSIEVQPANETIVWTGPTTLDYRAIGHYEDGSTHELAGATFGLDGEGARLGQFTDATFAPTGQVAGKGGVTALYEDLVGSTSVIVTVHRTYLGPNVPAGAETNFPDVSAPGAMSQALVYPLDQAVMPTSVKAPMLMWEGPAAGSDLYRVRVVAGFATIDTILAETPGASFQPEGPDWQLMVNSVPGGGAVTMSIDHWDATNGAHGGTPIQVKLIGAEITGAIYYWNLEAGEMERIDADGNAKAIPNPPPRSNGSRCVACHTVSRDGRYLSGSMWGGGLEGAVFDMGSEAVRTGNPAPTVAPLVEGGSYTQLFSTFNPDATRLMINQGTGLAVVNPMTAQSVATTGTPLPASGASHPAWSPDGTSIVYAANITAGGAAATWAVDYDRGDLAIIPVTGPDSFGAPATIVPAAGSQFAAPSWPTFAPDSQWIAYGAGNHSRGFNGGEIPGALFLVNKAGGPVNRLDNACGGATRCYLPNFSPYDAGGYFWLVYYSFKDYGNAPSGTKGTNRRQMWITAIDKSKLGTGVDPSSVPYWVPDQNVATQNMSAFWALPPPIQ